MKSIGNKLNISSFINRDNCRRSFFPRKELISRNNLIADDFVYDDEKGYQIVKPKITLKHKNNNIKYISVEKTREDLLQRLITGKENNASYYVLDEKKESTFRLATNDERNDGSLLYILNLSQFSEFQYLFENNTERTNKLLKKSLLNELQNNSDFEYDNFFEFYNQLSESDQKSTLNWLIKHGIKYFRNKKSVFVFDDELIYKLTADNRTSSQIKRDDIQSKISKHEEEIKRLKIELDKIV